MRTQSILKSNRPANSPKHCWLLLALLLLHGCATRDQKASPAQRADSAPSLSLSTAKSVPDEQISFFHVPFR